MRGTLARLLADADRALLRLHASMTPGQRWTGGLLIGVSLAVLVLGQPR